MSEIRSSRNRGFLVPGQGAVQSPFNPPPISGNLATFNIAALRDDPHAASVREANFWSAFGRFFGFGEEEQQPEQPEIPQQTPEQTANDNRMGLATVAVLLAVGGWMVWRATK